MRQIGRELEVNFAGIPSGFEIDPGAMKAYLRHSPAPQATQVRGERPAEGESRSRTTPSLVVREFKDSYIDEVEVVLRGDENEAADLVSDDANDEYASKRSQQSTDQLLGTPESHWQSRTINQNVSEDICTLKLGALSYENDHSNAPQVHNPGDAEVTASETTAEPRQMLFGTRR